MTPDIWAYQQNGSVKVFSELYVGISDSDSVGAPLGFATPYEDNSAGRKRQSTVDKWLVGRRKPITKDYCYVYGDNGEIQYHPSAATTRIVKNTPRPGFRITDDVKRVYYGGGNVVWRVEDPDGWEVEIQSQNLMAIIQSATIEKGGLITGNCIWGRSDGVNILLHETSEEYKSAVTAAEIKMAVPTIAKAGHRIGDLYRQSNGNLGIYLGILYVNTIETLESSDSVRAHSVLSYGSRNVSVVGTTRRVLPSEPYEAVLSVEKDENGQPKPGTRITLAKKVKFSEHFGSLQLPPIDPNFLNFTCKASFAAAANKSKILWISPTAIENPIIGTRAWTEEEFTSYVEALNRNRRDVSGKIHNTRLAPPYRLENVIMEDGLLFTTGQFDVHSIGHRPHGISEYEYWVEMFTSANINGPEIETFERYCVNSVNNDPRGFLGHVDRHVLVGKMLALPTFTTTELLCSWLNSKYDSGELLKIIVTDSVKSTET